MLLRTGEIPMRYTHEYPAQVVTDQMYGDIIFYGVAIVAIVALALILETYIGRRKKHGRSHHRRVMR